MRRSTRFVLLTAAAALTTALAVPAMATSSATSVASGSFSRAGSTIHVVRGANFNTRTSGNWFGYVQGTLEKPGRPRFTSRGERSDVAAGSIEYSPVTQPFPVPRSQRGVSSATLAAQRTRVFPIENKTEPAAHSW